MTILDWLTKLSLDTRVKIYNFENKDIKIIYAKQFQYTMPKFTIRSYSYSEE